MLTTKEAEKVDQANTPPDDDKLGHLLCRPCEKRDKQHAQPPAALCGKKKFGWSRPTAIAPAEQCLVCLELSKKPCTRCGNAIPPF